MDGILSRKLLAAAVGVIVLLTTASLVAGAPTKLPSVALGATWLLHIERVVAGAIAASVIVAVVVRTAYGQMPLKLGATSIEFESLKASAAESLDNLEVDIGSLRERVEKLEKAS